MKVMLSTNHTVLDVNEKVLRSGKYFFSVEELTKENNVKGKIIAVSMPQRARETGIDEGDRMVRLLVEDRVKLWLCRDDADWALTYLRDQLELKGVHRVAPDDRGPGVPPEAPGAAAPPGPLALTADVHPS